MSRIYSSLALVMLSASSLLAQASDESPYSSSTLEDPPGDFWATNGVVIFCAVIFFGLLIFVLLRGRKRA
ncbi:hypothetical protein LEM8419_01120 [Neolewinella maritima]|uniref:Uncharacterized protein n=1 Tax=Neolewinella maritima TaxID=1383882 RepID=A0ABM9AZM5_9BACT|nr:hypothetical protein [Neolewinella maritima]CAH0999833.1 hypothetical protein LEM8419_01120 [Neolewinella maritima]